MEEAYVTSKGQLVIPVRIRKKYGIKPGTKICFIEQDRGILFQPVTQEYIRGVRGMLKSNVSLTQALLAERAKDNKREKIKLEKLRVG